MSIFQKSPRLGFTLVELLTVVALMGILAGMMAFAMAGARQEARQKRAQAEIAAINSIVMQVMNEINLGPVELQPAAITSTTPMTNNPPAANTGIELNRVTMLARRDLMRMTLPQCRADLIYPPARLQYRNVVVSGGVSNRLGYATKLKTPAAWESMRRTAGFTYPTSIDIENTLSGSPAPKPFSDSAQDTIGSYYANSNIRDVLGTIQQVPGFATGSIDLVAETGTFNVDSGKSWTRQYESAECLYLILASTQLFGERALDQISSRMIANLDGDAVPEIIDPWGNPYEFIREPAGYGFPFFGNTVSYSINTSNIPTIAHPTGNDANDYLRTDLRIPPGTTTPPGNQNISFKTMPLIVSAGPDGVFGIRRTFDPDTPSATNPSISPRQSSCNVRLTAVPPASLGPSVVQYQYPDYCAYVGSLDSSNFAISLSQLQTLTLDSWFRGYGLGAPLHDGTTLDPSTADNIYSREAER